MDSLESLEKHEKILALSRMLDQWAEENLGDDPDWKPLEAVLPAEWCGGFMWMNRVVDNGVVIELYKHGITRHYLNLDSAGSAYRWTGTGYEPMSVKEATEDVFEGLEEMGWSRAAKYDDTFKAEKHRRLRESGWTVINVGPTTVPGPNSTVRNELTQPS
jgi:hypothetical protein